MHIPANPAAPRSLARRLMAFVANPLPDLPIKPLTLRERVKRIFRLALGVLAFGSVAAVAASPFTDYASTDMALALLDKVFSEPVGQVNGVVLGAALIVGGILTGYAMVAGTMQTAHDGEMLGKKWSSLWLPIRLAVGVAAVAPTPVLSNYCALQFMVAWIIATGTSFANDAWTAWVDSAFSPQGMTIGVPSANVTGLARGMLESAVCMEAARYARTQGVDQLGIVEPTITGSFETGRFYGGWQDDPKACGGVRYEFALGASIRGGASAVVNAIDRGSLNTGSSTVRAAHIRAAAAMEQDMNRIAKGIYTGTIGGESPSSTANAIRSAYTTSIANYQKTVADAALTVNNNAAMLKVKDTAKENGWVMAGGYYAPFLALQDSVSQAVADAPNAIAPVDQVTNENKAILAVGRAAIDYAIRDATGDALSNASVADAETSLSQEFMNRYVVKPIFETLQGGLSGMDGERHPLAVMKDLGNHLIMAGEGMVMLLIGAKVSGGIAAFIAKFVAGGGGVGLFIGLIVLSLFSMGFVLAYLLPMLPFIRWLGALVSWLVLAIEAMVAAAWWAIAHLHPEGDSFSGRGGPGYVLIIDLALRPLMMIVGLVFAYTLMQPLWWLVNKFFFSMFSLAQGQSLIGLFGLLAMLAIYTGIASWLCHHVLELMHWVPDHVIRWISGGGGDNMLAQGARSADGRAERSVMAIGGVINNRATLGALGADGTGKPKSTTALKGAVGEGGDASGVAGEMQAKPSSEGAGLGATASAGGAAQKTAEAASPLPAVNASFAKPESGAAAGSAGPEAGAGGAPGAAKDAGGAGETKPRPTSADGLRKAAEAATKMGRPLPEASKGSGSGLPPTSGSWADLRAKGDSGSA